MIFFILTIATQEPFESIDGKNYLEKINQYEANRKHAKEKEKQERVYIFYLSLLLWQISSKLINMLIHSFIQSFILIYVSLTQTFSFASSCIISTGRAEEKARWDHRGHKAADAVEGEDARDDCPQHTDNNTTREVLCAFGNDISRNENSTEKKDRRHVQTSLIKPTLFRDRDLRTTLSQRHS